MRVPLEGCGPGPKPVPVGGPPSGRRVCDEQVPLAGALASLAEFGGRSRLWHTGTFANPELWRASPGALEPPRDF